MLDSIDDLRRWATPIDARILDALERTGSGRAAARELGYSTETTVRDAMKRLKARAAIKGYAPEHDMARTVPDPFVVKGVSTYYDRDGKPAGQWVKTRLDDERRAAAISAAFEGAAELLPRLEPLAPPAATNANLCNVYTMTDCHVGMLAWHREGGADWDLEIAERVLTGCFMAMVDGAPRARVAVVNQLGDFLHHDGLEAVTPTSRHILDADGRFPKIVATAIRVLRRIVDAALARHEAVHVVMAEGNHDVASSVWLRAMFAALYENEPRLTVDQSPLPYYVHEFGEVMLAFAHGHLVKPERLPAICAAQFPAQWGRARKRYAHMGHRHHLEAKDRDGMRVIQHPTLAARDAHTARHGWASEREATAYTYHAEHGQVGSNTVTPEMVAA